LWHQQQQQANSETHRYHPCFSFTIFDEVIPLDKGSYISYGFTYEKLEGKR
jgi:hypothetical protein